MTAAFVSAIIALLSGIVAIVYGFKHRWFG